MKTALWIAAALAIVGVGSAVALAILLRGSVEQVSDYEIALRETRHDFDAKSEDAEDLTQELDKYKGRVGFLSNRIEQLQRANERIRKRVTDLTNQLSETDTTPITYSCGDLATGGAGVYRVAATGVTCDEALSVARAFWDGIALPDWSCATNQVAIEVSEARCESTSGGVVTFEFGA